MSVLKPGDTFLAFNLAHGGHLTHGMGLNFSGQLYNAVHYGVRESDHRIDFDQVAALAKEHRPKLIVAGRAPIRAKSITRSSRKSPAMSAAALMVDMASLFGTRRGGGPQQSGPRGGFRHDDDAQNASRPRSGIVLCREAHAEDGRQGVFPGLAGGAAGPHHRAKAVCFDEALRPSFKDYAKQIVANAKTLAETLMAGGVKLASGGTDNHLMLCDVTAIGLTGSIAEKALDKAGITVNKNMIPFDQAKPSTPAASASATPP